MKKNLSFLSKVGFSAAAVALVAGFAWAEGNDTTPGYYADTENPTSPAWTIPTLALDKYPDGTSVAFIGVQAGEAQILKNNVSSDGNTASFVAGSDVNAFTMNVFTNEDDSKYMTFTGAGSKRLIADGINVLVDARQTNNEVKWVVGEDGTGLTNFGSGNYLYYDAVKGQFSTSSTAGNIASYVKKQVLKPVFKLADYETGETNKNVIDDQNGTTLRYASYIATDYKNAKIVLEQSNPIDEKSSYYVEYTTAEDPSSTDAVWKKYTGALSLDGEGGLGVTTSTTTLKISARTCTTNEEGAKIDHTAYVTKTYTISVLDDPKLVGGTYGTWSTENGNSLTAADDAQADYKMSSNGATSISAKQTIGTGTPTDISGASDQSLEDMADYEQSSVTVTVSEMQASNGTFTTAKVSETFSLKPFYTKSEGEGWLEVATDPATSTEAVHTGLLTGNQIKLLVYSANSSKMTVEPLTSANFDITINIKEGDQVVGTEPIKKYNSEAAPDGWKTETIGEEHKINGKTGTAYVITLPEGINANTTFDVVLPAAAAKGYSAQKNSQDVYPISKEITVSYGVTYDQDAFKIVKTADCGYDNDDKRNAYISYNTSATNSATFKISADGTTDVVKPLMGSEYAIVRKSNNEEINHALYSVSSDGNGVFTVTFNSKPADGKYTLCFPAGTLVTDAAQGETPKTNLYEVTAYINIKDAVTFSYEFTDANGNANTKGYCENENVYVVVTTEGNSGSHPSFTYKGTEYLSGATINLGTGKALLEALTQTATDDGTEYTFKPAAGAITSNFSANEGTESVSKKIYKHITIAQLPTETTAYADVNNTTVTFNLATNASDVDFTKNTGTESKWKLGEKDVDVTINSAGSGTITLPTLDNKLDEGTYTLTIPSNVYASLWTDRDPCEPENITVSVTLTHPTFDFSRATTNTLTTHDREFTIKPTYTLYEGQEPTNAVEVPSSGDGEDEPFTYDDVDVKEGANVVGKLNRKTNTITLNTYPTAGYHTYTIAADSYKTDYSNERLNNGAETISVTFVEYVDWKIQPIGAVDVETSANGTDVKFAITVTPATVGQSVILPAIAANKLHMNSGASSVAATSVALVSEESSNGRFVYTAHFPEINPGYHLLNVTASGLKGEERTDINDPADDLCFEYHVYKVVNQFNANPVGNIIASTSAQDVTLGLTVKDSNNADRTSSVALNDNFNGWTIQKTGKLGADIDESLISETANGSYKLNFIFEEGTYTITAPEGAFKVDASTNKSAVTWTIKVGKAANWIANYTAKTMNYDEDTLVLAIDELQKETTLNYNQKGSSVGLFTVDQSKITVVNYNTQVPGSSYLCNVSVSVVGSSHIKLKFTKTLSKLFEEASPGANEFLCISFDEGALSASGQKNPYRLIKLNMSKHLKFIDEVDDKTTTKLADLTDGSYQTIKYTRTFTGVAQALSLPFEAKLFKDILEVVDIWKLHAVTVDDKGALAFSFKKAAENDYIYANKPYIVKSKEAGEKTITFANATVKKAEANNVAATPAVSSSSTTDIYDFYVTVDESFVPNSKYVLSKSEGKLGIVPASSTKALGAWRWYMDTRGKNINYVKIILEGEEDEETGIMEVESLNGDDVIFSISGVRLSAPQKGAVNIINGKKVYIK